MAARKTRKVSRNSNENDCYSGDKLKKRKELFIQQFEKEAQERVNEMEAKLDKVLTTLDRAFKIEMMKLPQSLHTTLIKDLMTAAETSVGEVTMAIASASPEISKPLSRKPSKKGKASNTAVQEPLMGQIKTEETSKRRTKIKMHPSNSTGSLRGASTTSAKRPHGRVKLSDQAHPLGIKMSVTNRSLSDDLSGIATATIMTSHGETLLLSEETKDDVKLELLDDMALCQIQKIKVGMVNAECVFLLHNYKMTSDYLLGFRS
ncbi:borealin-2 isoform X2 [Electrophorus electricus]|uniref:borealin-2 isoform X2 n=1 Tax=Electrophorus electricus TaxID=8005 RepID=UPI0015D09C19|nr:borealin-2 isoform X2 [Electrophorus electricus]